MSQSFAKLQVALRRNQRQQGDIVMAVVPIYCMEAVLVAVEVVLESGLYSVEYVLNVLARLNQTKLPEQVETSLKLTEES